MLYIKHISVLITCLIALKMVCAYPAEPISSRNQRLSGETESDIQKPLAEETLRNLYRYERALSRLRRAAEIAAETDYADEAADDMELAEINVFRPLFRYRAEIARQVKNPQRQFG